MIYLILAYLGLCAFAYKWGMESRLVTHPDGGYEIDTDAPTGVPAIVKWGSLMAMGLYALSFFGASKSPITRPIINEFGGGQNEPSGLVAFYNYSPAIHGIEYDSALGTGTGSGFVNNNGFDTLWTIVADSDVPGGIAAQGIVSAAQPDTCLPLGSSQWQFSSHTSDASLYPLWAALDSIGTMDSLYTRWFIKFSTNWEFGTAGFVKGLSIGYNHQSDFPPDWLIRLSSSNFRNAWQLTADIENDTMNKAWQANDGPAVSGFPTGEWVDIEFLIVAQTSGGSKDGSVNVWIDSVRITSWNNLWVESGAYLDSVDLDTLGINIVSATAASPKIKSAAIFNPISFQGSCDAFPVVVDDDTMWVGGLYMSGNL